MLFGSVAVSSVDRNSKPYTFHTLLVKIKAYTTNKCCKNSMKSNKTVSENETCRCSVGQGQVLVPVDLFLPHSAVPCIAVNVIYRTNSIA